MTSENSSDGSIKKSPGANDEKHQRSKKPYLRWLLAYFILAMLHGVLGAYFGIVQNPQGESCRYVKEGAPYHIIIEGEPCVFTSVVLIDMGLAFLLWAPVFLIIYAIVYGFRWLRKRLDGK